MNQTLFLKDKQINEKISFVGKITSINKGENFFNVDLLLKENFNINIKLDSSFEIPKKEKIYLFETEYKTKKEKKFLTCIKFNIIEEILDLKQIYYYYNHFFKCSPISFEMLNEQITIFLSNVKNPVLKKITHSLYSKNKIFFLISPAACKMHHDFYGGLGYHTLNMLKISKHYTEIYPFLNKDLLTCGIILHDMAKILEFNFLSKSYTKEGILLGHLILGVNNIHAEALLLGLQNTEEVLLLKHLLISHHGLLKYGSSKEPKTGEALLLWYLDDIDSKFHTLNEKIEQTKKGEFTENLSVIDGKSFYNPDL
ncbi:HD domain-containing protein [Columbia Basin potato purple top phytoplasma]|uniref:HD domain-containing protein n=1 Tax=Columbia Basin potato purple top phytoplasma TaxID=307134 RepID=A0ABT5L836_9MOLU|nr:HD domain-containing protein [Columbia Basin potato purple top phytoplasma]MDC9031845.1 HD domain-containing protein [Columbia Basin potato purple top phytoplasma]